MLNMKKLRIDGSITGRWNPKDGPQKEFFNKPNDITLLSNIPCGLTGNMTGRLYYYCGNFYQPLDPDGAWRGKINRAIREFTRDNLDRIKADQASPDYKDLLELFDEQCQSLP